MVGIAKVWLYSESFPKEIVTFPLGVSWNHLHVEGVYQFI